MSNSDAAHRLNQQLEKCQHFWTSAQGAALLDAQRACLGPVIDSRHKGHALEIVMGPSMLQAAPLAHIMQWAPCRKAAKQQETLICPLDDLALPDGCLDITLVHHWMEHTDNAHHLLQEAARVTSDHGILLIFGFNPYSPSNLSRRGMPGRDKFPDKGHQRADWRSPRYLHDWLAFVDFDIERVDYCGFRMPFARSRNASCNGSMETLGRRHNIPLGDSYMIRARRRQQPASTKRVKFGLQMAPTGRSVQAFSREQSARVSLITLPSDKRPPGQVPLTRADSKITSVRKNTSDTSKESKR
ncbi:MAG: methyltransferase domain-containing protein [Pseudomonadota bacterium]